MKRNMRSLLVTMALAFVMALVLAPIASAAERVVDLEITDVVTRLDRNGNEYTRLIVQEQKKLQGVEYKVGLPAMAFGAMNDKAKDLKPGDRLKAIVSDREYQGRSSLTIVQFL